MQVFKKVIIALLLSGFVLTTSWAADEGDYLPKFNIPTLSGSRLTNKTFQGKVSLLVFFGSWCQYCHYEQPLLMKIRNNYGVPIYGMDLKDSPGSARAWLQRWGNPYVLVGQDFSGRVADALNLYGTPQAYVIDKKGRIRASYDGGLTERSWDYEIWPLIQSLRNEK